MVQLALKVIGSLYLLYLAWKIATAGGTSVVTTLQVKPMTFAAALFQAMNPKAWMMTITLIGSFTLPGADYRSSVLLVVAVFSFIGFHCISLWAGFGTLVGHLFSSGAARQRITWTMGALTARCLVFIW